MGYAVDDNLKRDRDLLLNLFSRNSGPLGDYLNVIVRHIRIGLHREAAEGNHAPNEQEDRDGDYQKPVLESKIDGPTNHLTVPPYSEPCFARLWRPAEEGGPS